MDLTGSEAASGGYRVVRTETGEWMAYTVEVSRKGTYDVAARVASEGPGGVFHIEFDGVDKAGPMAVPDTGGWDTWQSASRPGVILDAGVHVMRLVMDSAGPTAVVGDFDSIEPQETGASH